jgi:hypothetical protein
MYSLRSLGFLPTLKRAFLYHSPRDPESQQHNNHLRYGITRLLVFSFLEISFLSLAARCIAQPFPLPQISPNNPASLQNAKAVTTAISVIWHALAGLVVKQVFGAEWASLYQRTGMLEPGETDTVSTITSGFFDQLK